MTLRAPARHRLCGQQQAVRPSVCAHFAGASRSAATSLRHAALGCAAGCRPGQPTRKAALACAAYVGSSAYQESVQELQRMEGQRSWEGFAGLQTLHIKDFALVADETVYFSPGVNIITGESGSGKSVLVEALNLISRSTAPSDCVRSPASCAIIQGTYALDASTAATARSLLLSAGLPAKALPDANQPCTLVVKREVTSSADGGLTRSRCYVNGAATSQRILRELGAMMVDANIQHSALALRDGAMQLQLLDQVAGTTQLAATVKQLVRRATQLETSLAQLDELADEDERKQMQELKDAVRKLRVEPNEELQLRQALKNMESRRVSAEQCAGIRMAVVGEPGSGGGVMQAVRALELQLSLLMKQEQQMAAAEKAARSGKPGEDEEDESDDEEEDEDGEGEAAQRRRGATAAAAALDALCQARESLGDAEQQVKTFARSIQFDASEHQRVSERLKAVDKLMRAHNCRSTAQLLQAAKDADQRLQSFYEAEEHQEDWEQELVRVQAQIEQQVAELSRKRQAAAVRLGSGVEAGLRELSMASSRFDVRISRRSSAEELFVSEGVFLRDEEARPPSSSGSSSSSVDTSADPGPVANHTANEEAPAASQPLTGVCADVGRPGGRWYHYAPGDEGVDVVEFLLAAGPGEPLRPLSAVASGGESARVMLALKAAPCLAFSNSDAAALGPSSSAQQRGALGTPVLILDELDSSIGARLGSVVGRMLRRICSPPQPASNQVICVTHLPQVACYADQHLRVKKHTSTDGRVATVFEHLHTPEQRTEEVAVMLGLEYEVAAEMLATASSHR